MYSTEEIPFYFFTLFSSPKVMFFLSFCPLGCIFYDEARMHVVRVLPVLLQYPNPKVKFMQPQNIQLSLVSLVCFRGDVYRKTDMPRGSQVCSYSLFSVYIPSPSSPCSLFLPLIQGLHLRDLCDLHNHCDPLKIRPATDIATSSHPWFSATKFKEI